MITKELLDFIKSERAKGFSDGAIKKMLTNNGWKEVDVDEAYNSLSGKVVQAGSPPKIDTSPAQPVNPPAQQPKPTETPSAGQSFTPKFSGGNPPQSQPKPKPEPGPEPKPEPKLSPSDEPKGEIDFSKIKTANKPKIEPPSMGSRPENKPEPKPEQKPIEINPNKTPDFKPVFQPTATPVNEAKLEAGLPGQKTESQPITMSNLGDKIPAQDEPKKKSNIRTVVIIVLVFLLIWVAGAYFLHKEGVINIPFLAPIERPAPEPIPAFKDLNNGNKMEEDFMSNEVLEEDEMSASSEQETMDLEETSGVMESGEEAMAMEIPTLTKPEAEELVYAKWGDCSEPGTCGGVLVSLYQNGDIYSVSAIYNNYDDSTAFSKRTAEAVYEDESWTLINEEVTWACHQGRGHQDFSTEPCI